MAWLRAVKLVRHVDDAQLARLLAAVPERRETLARRRRDDALRSITGELLARAMVSRHSGVPPGDVRFSLGEHGKPAIVSPAGWHHNLSHSGDWVVCALDDAEPIGVDVEAVRDFDPHIAERYFHPAELRWLDNQPSRARATAFFEVWSAKESYVKAIGVGLSAGLASFAVDLESGIVHGADGDWHLHRTPLDACHRLTTCARSPIPPLVDISDADELLAAALR